MSLLQSDEAGRLHELLDLARAHHDPEDARTADLAFVANQIQGQPQGVGAIIGAILSNPEVIKALMGLLFKAGKPEAPGPVPAPPPVAPPPRPQVSAVELKIHTIVGPVRTGSQSVPYRLLEDGTIQLTGDTTSLDDKSTIWLDAGVSGPEGGLRIDLDPAKTPPGQVNHPELLGQVVYIAEDAETGEELGRIGGKGLEGDLGHVENGVSFVPNRYAESGGMAANARIKRKGWPIRIYAELGDVESNGFVTPEVR